jgi:hypothetical protein
MDPLALVRRAKTLGLDGIVITEHDCLWPQDEMEELRGAEPGLIILSGVEVSAQEGHFLVYGVSDAARMPPGVSLGDLCTEAHRQGGAVVAAHPYRWGQPFDDILAELQPQLDGLEVMSNNMDADMRQRAEAARRSRGWTGLGNSDAHDELVVGCCYTLFDQSIRDQRDLVEAIRSGQARPRERTR